MVIPDPGGDAKPEDATADPALPGGDAPRPAVAARRRNPANLEPGPSPERPAAGEEPGTDKNPAPATPATPAGSMLGPVARRRTEAGPVQQTPEQSAPPQPTAPVAAPRRRQPVQPVPAPTADPSTTTPSAPFTPGVAPRAIHTDEFETYDPESISIPTDDGSAATVAKRRKRPVDTSFTTTRYPAPRPPVEDQVPDADDKVATPEVGAPLRKSLSPRVTGLTEAATEDSRTSRGSALPGGRNAPAERFDPSSAWHAADLSSLCPQEHLSAPNRIDPYWSGTWTGRATAFWYDRSTAERRIATGLLRYFPKQFLADPQEGTNALLHRSRRHSTVSTLGVLHAWRTATGEQLAAFTGNSRLTRPYNTDTAAAISNELVEIGLIEPEAIPGRFNRPHCVFRASRSETFESAIAPRLSYAEWIAVTGGQPWAAPSHYDRHNLLATELGLRAAEYCDVLTVLGERMCTADLLAGTGAGLAPLEGDRRSADACVVRSDGLRIAIEVTATDSAGFDRKVAKWAKLLADRPLERTGLMVCFVVAPVPGGSKYRDSTIRNRTYEAVAKAVREYPGSSFNRVAERIAVASWREWFPGEHLISDDFLGLRVDRPTKTDAAEVADMWEQVDLLDEKAVPFSPHDPARILAIRANASALGQTPYWLRDPKSAPTFVDQTVRQAGLKQLPNPTPLRPERMIVPLEDRRLGAARGFVRKTTPPPRLLGLADSSQHRRVLNRNVNRKKAS